MPLCKQVTATFDSSSTFYKRQPLQTGNGAGCTVTVTTGVTQEPFLAEYDGITVSPRQHACKDKLQSTK